MLKYVQFLKTFLFTIVCTFVDVHSPTTNHGAVDEQFSS